MDGSPDITIYALDDPNSNKRFFNSGVYCMVVLKKRNLIIIAIIVLIMAVILSSFAYLNFQKPYVGNLTTMTIGALPIEGNSLVYIADDQQYFAANGIKINYVNYSSGLAATSGLATGELDLAVASEFVLVRQNMQNMSLYTLASVSKTVSFFVMARTDKGISTISDLKNQTIGVTMGTNQQFFLSRFLELNGIQQNQISLLNLLPSEQPTALANGTINAVITVQPYVDQIKSLLGDKVVMWSAQANQPAYNELVCTKDWAAVHPDLIVRVLKALIQAENFNVNHKSQAMTIVAKQLNYTSEYLTSVWPNFQFSVTLDQSLVVAMQDEAQWLISNNLTNAIFVPNVLNYVYVDGLKSVKPGAVNIIG